MNVIAGGIIQAWIEKITWCIGNVTISTYTSVFWTDDRNHRLVWNSWKRKKISHSL